GLYTGLAGVALALAEGLSARILSPDENISTLLKQCFTHAAKSPDLLSGWAGQGLAILHCTDWLDNHFIDNKLQTYIDLLVTNQRSDGSWFCPFPSRQKDDTWIGLDRGVAGIIYFL